MKAADGFREGKSREHRKSPLDFVKVTFPIMKAKVNDEDGSPSEKEESLTETMGVGVGVGVGMLCQSLDD